MHEFHDSPGFGGIVVPQAMRIALPPTDAALTDVAAYISSLKETHKHLAFPGLGRYRPVRLAFALDFLH